MAKVPKIQLPSSSAPPPPPPTQEFIWQEIILPGGIIIRNGVYRGGKIDPLKGLERVQRPNHRQVELLSPIPKPPSQEKKKPQGEKLKPEKKKPQVITVILKVHMHCEACPQEIERRILRFKGVESAKSDLKSSRVRVKGVFDPAKLVEYVYEKTGKRGVIVKQEPEKKEEKPKECNKKDQKKGPHRAIVKQEAEKKEKKAGERDKKDQKKGPRRVDCDARTR